jgi:hypothetical protein
MKRGRQFLEAKIRSLEGTNIGGFVLVRDKLGKWSAAKYALKRVTKAEGRTQ